MEIDIRRMIDFIVKARLGFKVRRNSPEYIERYKSLLGKSKAEIIKLYKEI